MFNQILGDEQKRVGKWAAISLLMLSAFLLVNVFVSLKKLPSVGKEIYPQSTITISSQGEVFAVPDVASFSFTVVESGENVKSAQTLLNTKISKALAVIKDAGIEEKDVKTINYNVYPKYEWIQEQCLLNSALEGLRYPCRPGKNKLVGYEVSQTVSVKSRDMEKASDLVDKVGAVEVSNIIGLEFVVDDIEKYLLEAREQAISKVRKEAKSLAKDLGVRLGKVISFSDDGVYPPTYDQGFNEGFGGIERTQSMKAELPEGETKIISNVYVTYEIK